MTKSAIDAILGARGAQRPSIAPDGKTLWYCSDRDGRMQLWRTPVGGGPHAKLTDVDRVGRYILSPDGSTVAFAADRGGDEHWAVRIMPSAGGEARDLTGAPERIHHLLAWRPDERQPAIGCQTEFLRKFW